MKSLFVLVDGLGDDPIPAWEGKTPFSKAHHPTIDNLITQGSLSRVSICENDLVPESLSCILRLLGVPKECYPKNRAYLELLAQNRDISEYEMVLRCNVVSLDGQGRMVSFNGMGLEPQEKEEIPRLQETISKDIEFLHLSDYRNLLILTKNQQVLASHTAPPHESMGLKVDELLEELKNSSLVMKQFMERSEELLTRYTRRGLTYKMYPWGPSARTTLPSFASLNGLQGALVCKAEIVQGIGRALGMEVPVLERATGDVDTDIPEKLAATKAMLAKYPFVMTHFNGTDEAAHRHDYEGKAAFIEKLDREFLSRLLQEYREPLRIVLCGDHVTSSVTGKHTPAGVPVIAAITGAKHSYNIQGYQDIITFLMKESV